LAEHEVTRLLTIEFAIAEHFRLEEGEDPKVGDLKRDVAPEDVLRELELRAGEAATWGSSMKRSP